MEIEISSFGFKYGAPPEGDVVLDVRFVRNPYYVDDLRPLSGKDGPCADYVLADEGARGVLAGLVRLAEAMAPAFAREGRGPLRVRVGCTGGRHRSVALVEALAVAVAARGMAARVSHRDLVEDPVRI